MSASTSRRREITGYALGISGGDRVVCVHRSDGPVVRQPCTRSFDPRTKLIEALRNSTGVQGQRSARTYTRANSAQPEEQHARRRGRQPTSYFKYVQQLLGDEHNQLTEKQIANLACEKGQWRDLLYRSNLCVSEPHAFGARLAPTALEVPSSSRKNPPIQNPGYGHVDNSDI
ncbi:hypothetical protein Bbelb_378960 [Branchiostoma belcheri]|nr:hypothetical protein Bbelb_378960 [Branchiostoma belcheri]